MSHDNSRESTHDERSTWGRCPVCGAAPGAWCDPEVGLQLGVMANGGRMQQGEGAHLGRLQNAPRRVQLVGLPA